jgi:serine/threonine-protein kinase
MLPEAAVRSELERLLASPSLRDSDVLKRFLQYIVENTLAGEGDRLKEYRLGVEVFGRDPSFDPKVDPVVRMAARRLRAKLQEHYENGGRVASVRIEVPKGAYATSFVRVSDSEVAAGEIPSDRPSPGHLPMPESSNAGRRRMGTLAVAFVLLLTIGAAVLYLRHSRFLQLKNQPPSLAVLPFLNLTGNPDNEYLSDGITDEITGSVAKAAGLRVVARTSAFKFKGKSEDVREIGKQLNVSFVLEGSIQNHGDRLRTTARLIRTADGYHMWSETYEREFKDTFEVENEISRALAATLSARLSPAAESNPTAHAVDPLAHELCLRGRYFGQRLSLDDYKRATSYFNQAIDRDPLYADAYTGLAAAYVSEGANALAPATEVYPKARAAAERAIELDPNQPDAHAILANATFFYDWDLPGAERELKRAIELDPNSARAHQWYGILLYYSRRFDEAREQFQRARELAPLAIQVDLTMVLLYEAEHNYDQGIELSRKILSEHDHYGAHAFLASLYADKKQYPQAISEAQKAVAMAADDPDANLLLADIYAQSGQRAKALPIVRKFVDNKKALLVPFDLAVIYAILEDREQMYEWLDTMIAQRSPASLKLDVAEAFNPYRSEPRFQEILSKTGLPR